MNFRGVIIEESLANKEVLKLVNIVETKIEPISPRHKTPWVSQWTLHTVEIDETDVEKVAQILSESIDTSHLTSWYADFKNLSTHYIVFPNKIFRVNLSDPTGYKDAKEYGISIGIPDYQVDFDITNF